MPAYGARPAPLPPPPYGPRAGPPPPYGGPRPAAAAPAAKSGPGCLAVGIGGALVLVLLLVFAAIFGERTPSSASSRSDDSTAVQPASPELAGLSHDDSVRYGKRARAIVLAHPPARWGSTDYAWKNALADTVVAFGDTTDHAVRAWLAARRHADEESARQQAAEAERAADAGKWSYNSASDPMASRPTRTAWIESENTVEFGFPYQGPQHATLSLRNSPSYGHDVYLSIERGQILCESFEDCTVRVRFDDGPAERWSGGGPSDNSNTTVFIRGYDRFLQRLRKAKVVRIQIPVFQEGAPTFEFKVDGYDNTRYVNGG